MYALVQYLEDGILYISQLRTLKSTNNNDDTVKLAKYRNGCYYPAKILSTGGKKKLEKMLKDLQKKKANIVATPKKLPERTLKNIRNPHPRRFVENIKCPDLDKAQTSERLRNQKSDVCKPMTTQNKQDSDIIQNANSSPENLLFLDDSRSSEVCMPASQSCRKRLNFEPCTEELSKNDEIVDKSTDENDAVSNVPLCVVSLTANTDSGRIEFLIENMLHSGIYSGVIFSNEKSSYMGIISMTTNHETCVNIQDNVSGLISLNINTLNYECNIRRCMPSGLYCCQGYLIKSKNLLIGELTMENVPPIITAKIITKGSDINKKIISSRKRHYCPFCKKMQVVFGRHVINQHKNEDEVKIILSLPTQSKERKRKLSFLRGKGMHMYNMNRSINGGAVLVVRNPSITTPDNFVPCPNCKGYFLPRNVARHHKQCINRTANRSRVLHISKELQRPNTNADQILLEKLFSQLRDDEITETIKSDKVLILLASTMAVKYAKEKHLGNFMRQKLRQLARFLLKVRNINNQITDLESCIDPSKYNNIKSAVYELCELNVDNFTYKKPSMAAQLGAMIKDAALALKVQNIKDGHGDSHMQQKLDEFLLIHDREYGALVAKSAVSTLDQNKWNRPQIMPSIDDIRMFQEYINLRAENSCNSLSNSNFNYNHWLTLGRCCLLILLIFNRRRVGEISRTLIENFENRQAISRDQYKTLNRLECILANTFQRMEIRGKKGRRVPVLLTSRHIQYIKTLLRFRINAGVPESNPFIFGVTHQKGYIDGAVAIREYSIKCGASNPETLRGTYLRKQVATISQMLQLNDNEIQQLADFMGHDVAIHRLHYRKPEISLQITRLAKFFMVVSDTNMDKYRGKSLEELEVITSPNKDNKGQDDSDLSSSEENEAEYIDENKKSRNSAKQHTHSNSTIRRKPRDNHFKIPVTSTPRKANSKFSFLINAESPVRRIVRNRIRWSKEEQAIIVKSFGHHLSNKTLPTKADCERLRRHENIFAHRNAAQLKAWIYNQNKK